MTDGYWGKRTATIDWCEINYEVTHYIAEFWNTISNLVMIVFPLYSLYWSYNHYKFANEAKKNVLNRLTSSNFIVPKSVWLCQIGLMLVGIGSWMFHMTVRILLFKCCLFLNGVLH
jgi:dihydroceramidase